MKLSALPGTVAYRRPESAPWRTAVVALRRRACRASKGAERDEGTGKLTWRLTAPASGKVKVGFVYQLKHPKGYKVHQ